MLISRDRVHLGWYLVQLVHTQNQANSERSVYVSAYVRNVNENLFGWCKVYAATN